MAKYRSLLEELNKLASERDHHHIVESRAEHIIESAINLVNLIEAEYDELTAKDLTSRLVNSIKGKDSAKFTRGIRKVIKEARQ